MSLVEDLKAARALIDTPEKWTQGVMRTDDGRRCAVGACADVDLCIGTLSALYEYGGIPHGLRLAEFNDMEATTHPDIMVLFDRAIANAHLGDNT